MGVVHGLRAFLPRMLAAGEDGHVINTASVAGLLTAANPYHVSKHAVTCITEGLYKDLKRAGSKVSASVLCPGLIRTDILSAERNRPAQFGPATDLELRAESVRKAARDFAGMLQAGYEPAQVAQAVVDAIRADRFYVIPAQPFLVDLIGLRMQDILAQRNPTVPPLPGVAAPPKS
jgi:NAD(P)-dependent dehydrogenase (short-subunit alcohol dehydrogenase family)